MENHRIVINPATARFLNLRDLWQHRELLLFFAWRDLKVKYKQTVLGVLWAVLQPLALLLLFSVLFSKTSIAKENVGMPYTVFVLSGLVLWNLFYTAVSQAADSMVSNAAIIKKIYFPRLLIPLSTLLTALIDFGVALLLFTVFCIVCHQGIHWSALWLFPAAVVLCLLAAFGLGTLLSALNVKYRDFRYALPFGLQALFFSTQIIYDASIVRVPWLTYLFALNPMNAAVELFRMPMRAAPADMQIVGIGTAAALLFAAVGFFYFKKTEAYFADII